MCGHPGNLIGQQSRIPLPFRFLGESAIERLKLLLMIAERLIFQDDCPSRISVRTVNERICAMFNILLLNVPDSYVFLHVPIGLKFTARLEVANERR